jgi:hypothetical protein
MHDYFHPDYFHAVHEHRRSRLLPRRIRRVHGDEWLHLLGPGVER